MPPTHASPNELVYYRIKQELDRHYRRPENTYLALTGAGAIQGLTWLLLARRVRKAWNAAAESIPGLDPISPKQARNIAGVGYWLLNMYQQQQQRPLADTVIERDLKQSKEQLDDRRRLANKRSGKP